MVFFLSFSIESTKYAIEDPGAYQADVPNNLVNVAPPTIVDFTTFSISSLFSSSVRKLSLCFANLCKGIIVVSPWPPITIASIFFWGLFIAREI